MQGESYAVPLLISGVVTEIGGEDNMHSRHPSAAK
jgi:hypothetical protein